MRGGGKFLCALMLFPFGLVTSLAQQEASSQPPPGNAELQAEINRVEAILPKLRDPGGAFYLLAGDYAQLGRLDQSLRLLKQCLSLDEGFDPSEDPAFSSLAPNRAFQALADRAHYRNPRVSRAHVVYGIPEKDLIPEGLTADPKRHVLYLGSLHNKKILQIKSKNSISRFDKVSSSPLLPVLGMRVDAADHHLWANTAASDHQRSELVHFDGSGVLLERFPVTEGGPHLLNDLVLRGRREIFLTDSLANQVYRFDRIDHTFTPLTLSRPIYYPNGIALSEDHNRLYVADAFGVIQLNLKSNTAQDVDPGSGNTLAGIDGMYWYRGSLVSVQNGIGLPRIARFHLSSDGLRVISTDTLEYRSPLVDLPTTGSIVGDLFYFISNAGIDNLRGDEIIDPSKLRPVRISVARLR